MPIAKARILFLEGAVVVAPAPRRINDYVEHRGKRRGHSPSSPEIAAEMMARFGART